MFERHVSIRRLLSVRMGAGRVALVLRYSAWLRLEGLCALSLKCLRPHLANCVGLRL